MIDAREAARKTILGAVRYSGLAAVAAPFLAGVGAILMLHRVNRTYRSPTGMNSGLCVTPEFLDALLGDLKKQGYRLVSLDEMVEQLKTGRGGRFATITADDGYLDNLVEALPVFEAHEAPFAIYVAPALSSGEVAPWWEVIDELVGERDTIVFRSNGADIHLDCSDAPSKRKAVARLAEHFTHEVAEEDQQAVLAQLADLHRGPRRFMNREEIGRLADHRLATIGAHTVHHYSLARLTRDDALREMTGSAAIIERETGRRPRHFAYPYGNPRAVGQREVDLAQEVGFLSAVTTRHGVLQAGHAAYMHALPRISINGNFQKLSYVRTLLSGVTTPLNNGGKRLVTL